MGPTGRATGARGIRGGRRTMPSATRTLGVRGEDAATAFLESQGCVVLARNWRCRDGEIDIIARDQGALVICEVKTRSGDGWGSPAAAVTPTKMRRLRVLTRRWLDDSDLSVEVIRFDVIAVLVAPDGQLLTEWFKGVT